MQIAIEIRTQLPKFAIGLVRNGNNLPHFVFVFWPLVVVIGQIKKNTTH